jgi:hypothetical protein
MMLPFRRRPISPKPSVKIADNNHPLFQLPPADAHAVKRQHLDYNHQPLAVESLSHYIQPEADERFRVH